MVGREVTVILNGVRVINRQSIEGPTAIAIAKRSFNADSDHIRGIGNAGLEALALYYQTEESKEGVRAFLEKRKPDFRKARGQ